MDIFLIFTMVAIMVTKAYAIPIHYEIQGAVRENDEVFGVHGISVHVDNHYSSPLNAAPSEEILAAQNVDKTTKVLTSLDSLKPVGTVMAAILSGLSTAPLIPLMGPFANAVLSAYSIFAKYYDNSDNDGIVNTEPHTPSEIVFEKSLESLANQFRKVDMSDVIDILKKQGFGLDGVDVGEIRPTERTLWYFLVKPNFISYRGDLKFYCKYGQPTEQLISYIEVNVVEGGLLIRKPQEEANRKTLSTNYQLIMLLMRRLLLLHSGCFAAELYERVTPEDFSTQFESQVSRFKDFGERVTEAFMTADLKIGKLLKRLSIADYDYESQL